MLLPSIISATVGEYSTWSDLIAAKQVSRIVVPDSEATKCGVIPEATSATTSAIDFTIPGTWNVTYLANCTDGNTVSANLVVWIKPTGTAVSSGTVVSSVAASSVAASSSAALSSIPVSSSTPLSSSSTTYGYAIPGHIEAEDFSQMFGISTQSTSDAGGTLNIGWIDANDWVEYSVNVAAAGNYKFTFRVAAPSAGGAIQIVQGGTSVGTAIAIPATGGFQTWTNVVSGNIPLAVGNSTLRLNFTSGGFNINYFDVALATSSSSSVAASSSTNHKPTGGACTLDKNSVTTGNSVVVHMTSVWTDPDNDAVASQYNFHNGAGWVTTSSGSWSSASTYAVTIRGVDANSLPSDTVNCSNSPVTVTASSNPKISTWQVAANFASGSCFDVDVSATAPGWAIPGSIFVNCAAPGSGGVTQTITYGSNSATKTDGYNAVSLSLGTAVATNVCVTKSTGGTLSCQVSNY